MRIEFDDEEYPELSRYLENPKRRMKFLYFLEELFTLNNYDPIADGLVLIQERNKRQSDNRETKDDSELYKLLTGITSAIEGLAKNMDGVMIGRFPTEHIVHEVVQEAPKSKKPVEMDETDYSSTEGIDFGPSIAMFED